MTRIKNQPGKDWHRITNSRGVRTTVWRNVGSAFTATKGWAGAVGSEFGNDKRTYLERVMARISRDPMRAPKRVIRVIETAQDDQDVLRQQWARRIKEGRDPVTGRLPFHLDKWERDEFGLTPAGLFPDGSAPFGQIPWMEKVGIHFDEREFDYRGIHKKTGTKFNQFGADAQGWLPPLQEDRDGPGGGLKGQRLHCATGTPFAPNGKDWDGLSSADHFELYAERYEAHAARVDQERLETLDAA